MGYSLSPTIWVARTPPQGTSAMNLHLPDHERIIAELMAAFAAIGGLTHMLPALATLLAVVWYGIQIYDRLLGRPKKPRGDTT